MSPLRSTMLRVIHLSLLLAFTEGLFLLQQNSAIFNCGNERTVFHRYRCDGDDDCGNGADESNCINNMFDCGNERTVPGRYLCDGDEDCRNGADERDCSQEVTERSTGTDVLRALEPTREPGALFRFFRGRTDFESILAPFDCENGKTVPVLYKCDGDDDCGNGADERNCTSGIRDFRTTLALLRFSSLTREPVTPGTINLQQTGVPDTPGFDCGNGNTVPHRFLCDGDDDCRNGNDERNCSHVRFDCGNGLSVPNGFLCDGGDDCGNFADESNCSQALFDCGNGRSVPNRFLCDGDNDCGNGADERNCSQGITISFRPPVYPGFTNLSAPSCQMGLLFNCGNGRYIMRNLRCDGQNDCGNLADEEGCNERFNIIMTSPSSPRSQDVPLKLEDEAVIRSPDFPEDYPHNLNIRWNVTTALGHRIRVDFKTFELEDSTDCRADSLTLYDGAYFSSPALGTFCRHDQSSLPEPVTSSSNSMVLHFTSDSSVNWKGFDLALSTVCGGTLLAQASENVLVSHPKYGHDGYGENLACDWIIKSRPERNVEISFSDFDLGRPFLKNDNERLSENIEVNGCENSNSGNCVQYYETDVDGTRDFVEIFDGADDSSNRIGKYFGNGIPPTITSRGEELLVRFRSNGDGSFRGFRAQYKEV